MSFTPGQVIPPDPNAAPAPSAPPPQGRPPRRISVFGGLLWILIGSLLLINNLVDDFRVWQLFRTYWPVLLILLGLTKLLDHFTSRQTGAPPARLVTGGEIFLVIMLLLIGGAIAARDEIVRVDPDFETNIHLPWEEEFSFAEEVAVPTPTVRPVRIEIARGNIAVIADDAGELRAIVNKRVRADNEEAGRERVKDVRVEIVEQGGTYVVRPRSGAERWVRLDVEVHVAPGAAVSARTGRGNIRLQGVQGNLTVDADGGLEARDVKGLLEAKVDGDVIISGAGGDVRIDGSCDDIDIADVGGGATVRCGFTGRATLRNIAKQVYFKSARTEMIAGTLPGRMTIGSGDLEVYDAPKDVSLTTRNYDILMDKVAGRIQVENRNGKIEVRFPLPPTDEINLTNERGGVELTLPARSAFEISANSERGGDMESDFEGLTISREGRDRRMEGRVGSGGPSIRIRTTYDDVTLRKAP